MIHECNMQPQDTRWRQFRRVLTVGLIACALSTGNVAHAQQQPPPIDHQICSESGFASFNSIPAFTIALIFAGIDIKACADHLLLTVAGNFLVINFEEHDALIEAGRLQHRGVSQVPLFTGPFTCPPMSTSPL